MSRSIIPPTGAFGSSWPGHPNLPQGASGLISAGGWSYGNEGFIQQTFLGASIRNFNVTAGFGDTASNLAIQLVEDEYNKSDGTGRGLGDDVYHNGVADDFIPPAVGSPAFFKFGKTFATVEQAWRPILDEIYNVNTLDNDDVAIFRDENEFPNPLLQNDYVDLSQTNRAEDEYKIVNQPALDKTGYNGDRYDPPNTTARGKSHIVFGGILQSYTETKGPEGNPLYSAQITDPREILSNATVILNNYAGSVFGNKNYLNVYGFLEYDVGDALLAQLQSLSQPGFNIGQMESYATWVTTLPFTNASTYNSNTKVDNRLEKVVDITTGNVFYFGNDMYRLTPFPFSTSSLPEFFPMTGQGFSRRSAQGIPWYRVRQGLEALFNYNGFLPQEYVDKGFGGPINFRGYNYVVDFTGIPIEKIPQMYFLDFDQIDLLSLCQELCDVISHDLFISLLPIINHPSCQFLFEYNNYFSQVDPSRMIAGIIRVDAIDRSTAPRIGVIKEYLDSLESRGIHVTNQDLGYELSNVTTDKIVAGAQEVEMYYFSSNKDRDKLELRKYLANEPNNFESMQADQWSLETSLKQQILPFYGFLGKQTPTIPIGFGAYQQILLDSSAVDAYGVGSYYVTTEMELRAALVSYESWSRFLLQYNEMYMEEVTSDQVFWNNLAPGSGYNNKEYAVSVPRCVFISEKNYVGDDGYPASPCSPPYGYPLYFKRAEKIGIPEAGILFYQNELIEAVSRYDQVKNVANKRDELLVARNQASFNIENLRKSFDEATLRSPEFNTLITDAEDELRTIESQLHQAEQAEDEAHLIRETLKTNERFIKSVNSLASLSVKNAKKVYEFVRNVAETHLGKTFLVKIPKQCNVNYSSQIQTFGQLQVNNILTGPYGFRPIPINGNISQIGFDINIQNYRNLIDPYAPFEHYLDYNSVNKYTYGALKGNFNPISDTWEFNYKPEPQGGFFNFALFDRSLSFFQINELPATSRTPFAQAQLLAPLDLTNFKDGWRIKTYVRFDHSEFLDFSNVSKDKIFQQIITAEGFVPDVLEELNNTNVDENESFRDIQKRLEFEQKPPSVAFVSCEVDPELYLLPKLVVRDTPVFARIEQYVSVPRSPILNTETDIDGCLKTKVLQQSPVVLIQPLKDGGLDGTTVDRLDFNRYYSSDLNADIINTEAPYLNNEHVYAIITLPGRVIPTVDQRYLDGPWQAMNGVDIKHILTMDVVRGAPGFDKPAPWVTSPTRTFDCKNFTFEQLTKAQKAQRDAMVGVGMANPSISIGFSQPSPVYPDLVALPLMSMERCYGPWISSSIMNGVDNRVRYSDIGGKVEFVKDENLAPWNYAGYQLMNEAGALQAQFSNSLLLFSERGGFTVPDFPDGLILARPLAGAYGPLVTTISVDIGDSVQTTVKMDLYTSRFGKLQKQKEEAIGMIVRERQRTVDQNNTMIRQGVLKGKTGSTNLKELAGNLGGNDIVNINTKPITHLIVEAQPSNKTYSDGTVVQSWGVNASLQRPEDLANIQGVYNNLNVLKEKYEKTAAVALERLFAPISNAPDPNMASVAKPIIDKSRIIGGQF